VHLLDGDVNAARDQIDQARSLISARVTARWEDVVGYAEGLVLQHEGQLADAERRLGSVFGSAGSGGRRLHTVLSGASLADLYTAQGRLDETSSILDDVAHKVGSHTERAHVVRLSVGAARVARTEGRIDEAALILDSNLLRTSPSTRCRRSA
jgi:ATP/maltotriose-dependent transcriptional regulator MalT